MLNLENYNMLKPKHILLLVSFIEGASVMATEIGGAKLLAPYYGSSLYVWSSVMAVTLSGLAFGYFYGGKKSRDNNNIKTLSLFLFLAGLSVVALPYISGLFHPIAQMFPLISAVVISVCVILFAPIFLMGTTSPLIISTLTTRIDESGERSGLVYAVSTIGGIISTFLCGFYFIPYWGIKTTLLFFGLLLVLCSLMLFFQKKKVSSAV